MESVATLGQWAKVNPLLVGGLGLVVGGFFASAFPATAAERGIADMVGAGLRAAAAQGAAQAAGAAVRAAANIVETPQAGATENSGARA